MATDFEDLVLEDEEGEQALREQELDHAGSNPSLALPIVHVTPQVSTSVPDWMTSEDLNVQREVFLITFASVLESTALMASTPVRTLDGLTRENVRDAVLDAIGNPIQDSSRGGRPRTQAITVICMVTVREEPLHFHVALKLSAKARFLPFKTALRQRSGLASHWSTSHSEKWSAIRYCTHQTDHKDVDQQPLVWLANEGHLADSFVAQSWLFENSQERFMASVIKRRREVAVMNAGTSKLAKTEKFGKLDFIALVQDKCLRSPNQAIAYMCESGSKAMQAWTTNNQSRLKEYIRHAEEWAEAPAKARTETESGWDLVKRLFTDVCDCTGTCCGWVAAADAFFERNHGREASISALLSHSLCEVLSVGR